MALSPMMRQYLITKEQYKDCILLYRLGDFYEMFYEDAIKASEALDLVLTGKNCGEAERAPMCGIPYHAADNYISIWYLKNGQLKKQLVRTTLKETSNQLADTSVVRTHRSFMINIDKIKVLRREKENLFIELDHPGLKDIPVSKTYGEELLKRLVPVK